MSPRSKALAVVAAIAMGFLSRASFSHETLTTTVLFDREIVRILNKHCVMCHTENGPSFPLETYEQTWLQGRKMRSDVIARHMPPWSAVPGYGQFSNDNSLTLRETQFIVSWVEGLGPRNSGTVFLNVLDPSAPRPKTIRAHADFDHWQLDQPSVVRDVPANTVEAQARDEIKRVVIDLGLTVERRVRALEYRPGDRRVVRAAFFTLQETGQWLGSWTPWHGFTSLPRGVAYRLPAGSHVVAEIHYRGMKERVLDAGKLGVFFSDQASTVAPSDLVLEASPSNKVHAQTRLTADMSLIALRPEFSPGVKSIEVSARKPDGGTDVLLFTKDLQPDWPTPYIFKQPVTLRAGTELSVTAYYDKQPGGVRLTISRYAFPFPSAQRGGRDIK
jgi:hypothetical protein